MITMCKKISLSPVLNVLICSYVVGNLKSLRLLLCQQGQYLVRGEVDGEADAVCS